MDLQTILTLSTIATLVLLVCLYFLLRCSCQGKACTSRYPLDGKVAVITGADSQVGIELVRELCKRGAERVIMAVKDVQLGQDVAVDVRGETNGDVVVEFCDMASLRSVRDFCSKVLESESRVHILINQACIMWSPLRRTAEGHEMHWGANHLAHFVMTQLLMPLLIRGAPDSRVITITSWWHTRGRICWEDPDYLEQAPLPAQTRAPHNESSSSMSSPKNAKPTSSPSGHRPKVSNSKGVRRKYKAWEAFNQSKLANVLFTRELGRRLEGTGVNAYAANPGNHQTGLGWHILQGMGCFGAVAAGCCWLPWVKSVENATQTIIYCATEPSLADHSGFYYSDCSVQLTSEAGANLDDAYRLWEMSERMVGLTS